ncbi:putative phage abortive infection protein [Planomicrobium okeanokoites]|uniref:putative phage abortive infection protein n=1 Tax=Planomicrobium okeanokoites TaxID=244 RepID=UPI000A022DFD|nr:putative phage abortive infection protein [Planomicrobium okeanokoites]
MGWYEKLVSSKKIIISLVVIALIMLVSAFLMPIFVRAWYAQYNDYNGLANLGVIGDFLGGTTVGLLSTGSILLLLATLLMQRRELKISQRSIDELVAQTTSAKEQAIEAREETKITNSTMKKQQFDSTFFNMINLHHNILKEIKYYDLSGRYALEKILDDLNILYDSSIYIDYREKFISKLIQGNSDELNNFSRKVFIAYELSEYIDEFERHTVPLYDSQGNEDFRLFDEFFEALERGTDKKWNEIKEFYIHKFEKDLSTNSVNYRGLLSQFNFVHYIKYAKKFGLKNDPVIQEFNKNYFLEPLKTLKIQTYEKMYKENESIIGHYYRNLYRIVKLIHDQDFEEKPLENEAEKQKYRGILRAQLSSMELQMLFYNVTYSIKGEKFKNILKGTNFFDDHLAPEKFIWPNDIDELKDFTKSKPI